MLNKSVDNNMSIPQRIPIPAAIAIVLASVLSAVLLWMVMRPPTIPSEDNAVTPIAVEKVQALALDDAARGDIDAALRLYDRQIAARPNGDEQRELLLSKSSLAASRGRYDNAIVAAKQAASMRGSDDPEALRALAEAYAASGDKTQALTTFKRILATSPKGDPQQANSLQRGPSIEAILKDLEQ